jgi:ABC-2 type transport system permease protein
MFGHVFGHELRLFRQNPSWWGSLLALMVLTVIAAWNGDARSVSRAEPQAALETSAAQLENVIASQLRTYEASPGAEPPATASAGALGFSILSQPVFLPSGPLRPLALGQSDTLPDHYPVTAHAAYSFMNSTDIVNPNNLLAGSFDVAFVMVFVLPVFIIALVFDLLSREKERGLLALTMAHGVSLPSYTLAKCFARSCIVLGVTVLVTLLGFLVAGVDFNAPGVIADAAAWLLVVLLYALFWFAVGLFVNALDCRSETNGILMANTWLVAVVVLPALVNVIATAAFPAPSRVTLTTELREAAGEAEENAAAVREAYFFDHPELAADNEAPGAFFREVLASELAIERSIAPLLEAFESQAAERAGVVDVLMYLSPAILTQQALTAIAGTEDARYTTFRHQVREFHQKYRTFFADRLLADQPMTAADLEQLPEFEFAEPDSLDRVIAAALALLLFSMALVAGALRLYRSYPVLQSV